MGNKISVITAAYNSEKYIINTIESVIGQTYKNWEMLIVDDCSSDSTPEIIKRYANLDKRIKPFYLTRNVGAGEARNVAIKNATGRFLAFVDSDDLWMPTKLESQVRFMLQNEYSFTYTGYSYIDEQGNRINRQNRAPLSCSYSRLLLQNCIGCSTVIIDISILGKQYMPDIRRRQDWCLWLFYSKISGRAYRANGILTDYRVRKGSVSYSKGRLIKYHWKVYKEVMSFSQPVSAGLLLINLAVLTLFYLGTRLRQ